MKYNLFIKGTNVQCVANVEAETLPRVGDTVTFQLGSHHWLTVVEVQHHVLAAPSGNAETYSVGVHTQPYRLNTLLQCLKDTKYTNALFKALEDESLEGLLPDLKAGLFSVDEVERVYEAFKKRAEQVGLKL